MAPRQWFDRSQPQTLQNAVLFCYLNAALSVFYALIGRKTDLLLLPLLLLVPAAYFIANDRKAGYLAAVALSGLNVGLILYVLTLVRTFSLILNLLFAIVLVILLLHPMSRSYARIYFR